MKGMPNEKQIWRPKQSCLHMCIRSYWLIIHDHCFSNGQALLPFPERVLILSMKCLGNLNYSTWQNIMNMCLTMNLIIQHIKWPWIVYMFFSLLWHFYNFKYLPMQTLINLLLRYCILPWFWSIVLYLLVIVYILNVCSIAHVVIMSFGFVVIKLDFQIHIQDTIS
jgi:hypothetical protein